MVVARSGSWALVASSQDRVAFTVRIESWMRAAALPVGAATAMRSLRLRSNSSSKARINTSVCVLPVPGPPEMTQNFPRTAASPATPCQLMLSPGSGGKRAWSFWLSVGGLRRMFGSALEDCGGQALLVFPVAVEVEPVAGIEDQRLEVARRADDWRRLQRFVPVLEARKLDWSYAVGGQVRERRTGK